MDKDRRDYLNKIRDLLGCLEIPVKSWSDVESYGDYDDKYVHIEDLYKILMDVEKVRLLSFKLRNKAFW